MDRQITIDFSAAEAAKVEAIDRVECNNRAFVAAAFVALVRVAGHREVFSAREVWAELTEDFGAHPRAMGAVFRRAAKEGLIVATKEFVKSGRTTDHNQQLRLWRSLVKTKVG